MQGRCRGAIAVFVRSAKGAHVITRMRLNKSRRIVCGLADEMLPIGEEG
jgi:hypothetical protein